MGFRDFDTHRCSVPVLLCVLILQNLAGCAGAPTGPYPTPSPSPSPSLSPVLIPKTTEDFAKLPPRKAPQELPQKLPTLNVFRCERAFTYQGKVINCDSNGQPDGEGLRAVIQDTPAAVTELDTYQENRRTIKEAAYVGSLGLVLALGGILLSGRFTDSNGNLTSVGHSVRTIGLVSGISILSGSVIYGLVMVRANENHLSNAASIYNTAHPEHPIELQFSTGLTF